MSTSCNGKLTFEEMAKEEFIKSTFEYEPLFCDDITQTMKMDLCESNVRELVDPASLSFNRHLLETAIKAVVADSDHLNDRVTALLPLCRSMSHACHAAVQRLGRTENSSTDDVFTSIWASSRLDALISECPTERVLGLVSVTARLEWIVSCLVDRRLQLKDNLESNILRERLGFDIVLIMQCLMGCVKGFNLKNLTWHGFVSPANVPPQLCSLLFCTALSLTDRLTKTSLKIREKVSLPCLSRLGTLPELPFDILETVIRSSSLVHPDHVILWLKLLEISKQQWKTCAQSSLQINLVVSLNVVLFQHCLRMLWITLTQSDRSRCGAKNDEFYVTMDEIFSPTTKLNPTSARVGASYYTSVYSTAKNLTHASENVLIPYLGRGKFHAILDLFTHGQGLRLRDKLSHCECPMISREVFQHILYLSFSVLSDFCSPELGISPVLSYWEKYHHHFHPETMIQEIISDIDSGTDKLSEFLIDAQSVEGLKVKEQDCAKELNELCCRMWQLSAAAVHSSGNIPLFIGLEQMKYYSLLLEILRNIRKFSVGLLFQSSEKLKLFQNYMLRSRQRQNFNALVGYLPYFISTLRLSAGFAKSAVAAFQCLTNWEFEHNKDLVKVLKVSLKCFENNSAIVSLSKWIEIELFLKTYLETWSNALQQGIFSF